MIENPGVKPIVERVAEQAAENSPCELRFRISMIRGVAHMTSKMFRNNLCAA